MTTQGNLRPTWAVSWDSKQLAVALASAHHHASRDKRTRHLSRHDRDDLRQDILVAMLQRSRGFDPSRSAWSTFVGLVARHVVFDRMSDARGPCGPTFVELDLDDLPAGTSATQQDSDDVDLLLDLDRVADALPASPRTLLRSIREHGDVADAQRACAQSPAGFYRGLTDLRFWLRATGMRPARGMRRQRSATVG